MKELARDINANKCLSCNSRIINDGSQLVCTECGLVHSDTNIVADNHGKFQAYNIDKPLGSCVDSPKRRRIYDNQHKTMTPDKSSLYGRLRKLDRYFYFMDDIKLHVSYGIATKIISHLRLNKIILDKVMFLFKKILTKKQEQVKNRVTLLATCFYIILKEEIVPIPTHEIVKAFRAYGHRVSERQIFQVILNLNLKVKRNRHPKDYMESHLNKISNIHNLDARIQAKLNMTSFEYLNKIRKTVYKILESKICHSKGYQPQIVAASIIYFSTKLIDKKYDGHYTVSQEMISEATGVALYSIRDVYVKVFRKYINKVEG